MLVLAACQDDKLGDHEKAGNATLTLNFNSSDNTLSRAVSSDEDEQIISNAYVFVFNQDGTRCSDNFTITYTNQRLTRPRWRTFPPGTARP